MLRNKRKILALLIVIGILFLGYYLRHNNYRTIPRHGATFDEFAWTWLGVNLIQKGVPMSWSSQPQYTNRKHLIYQGAAFWIVTPYLEHPPLFGLLAGSFAFLRGADDMYDITLAKIRPFALLLGTFSIAILFLLTNEIYGKRTAFLAALLYATIPTIVIGSRILQNENFFIPFWLLSIYLIIKYLKTKKIHYRNYAAIIAGLLTLAKVPWIVAGFSLCLILSYKRKWKDSIYVGLITLGIFLLFLLYGVYFDKELFINLWKLQTARYDITFHGFYSIFLNPLLVDRYYLDGWILFGWFAVVLLFKKIKEHFFILIPFLAYLFMYVFAIPDEPSHGWYRYPFYPFLAIAIAVFIEREFVEESLVRLFFLLLVGLSLLTNAWQQVFGFSLVIYRLFLILAFISGCFPLWFKKYRGLSNILLLLWIGLFILGNISAVFIFNDF